MKTDLQIMDEAIKAYCLGKPENQDLSFTINYVNKIMHLACRIKFPEYLYSGLYHWIRFKEDSDKISHICLFCREVITNFNYNDFDAANAAKNSSALSKHALNHIKVSNWAAFL